MCVNMGKSRAVKILQNAANNKNKEDIDVDGGLGPATRKALEGVEVERVRAFRVKYYADLVEKKESLQKSGSFGLYSPRIKQQILESKPLPHSKATMCRNQRYKFIKRAYEMDEFYDLQEDPGEINNLISNSKYQNEIDSLRDKLLNWYQKTCDVVPFKMDERNFEK